MFASHLHQKSWDKIVWCSLISLTKNCCLSPKNMFFLWTVFAAVANGNHWEVICIVTILALVEEVRDIKHCENAMEWYLHSYFLSQASNDEIWKQYDLVVPYLSLVLVLNLKFLAFKNSEVFIIIPTSVSGSVDASENEKSWKNAIKEVEAKDLLILVSSTELSQKTRICSISYNPFPRYTLLRKIDYWQRPCFDSRNPSHALVKLSRSCLPTFEIQKPAILLDLFDSASFQCLGRIPCPGAMGQRTFFTPRRPRRAPAASLVYGNARVWITIPRDPDKS